jgi:hypothetical protein
MKSVLAPWLSDIKNAPVDTRIPQRRVLLNGIAQFPVFAVELQSRGPPNAHAQLYPLACESTGAHGTALSDSQADFRCLGKVDSRIATDVNEKDDCLPLPKRRIIIEDDDKSSNCSDHTEPCNYSGMPALLSDSDDSVDEQAMSDEEGNLWNAVPPLLQQAAHGSSTSSGSTGSSDGSLSDEFIDKSDPAFTYLQEKVLMRYFPIMCKDMFMVD